MLAKLAAEVDAEIGDRAVTVADLPRLPYTLAVIEEAMRLHPPVYALAREASEDIDLGGHRFGARSTIFIASAWKPDPLDVLRQHWMC